MTRIVSIYSGSVKNRFVTQAVNFTLAHTIPGDTVHKVGSLYMYIVQLYSSTVRHSWRVYVHIRNQYKDCTDVISSKSFFVLHIQSTKVAF